MGRAKQFLSYFSVTISALLLYICTLNNLYNSLNHPSGTFSLPASDVMTAVSRIAFCQSSLAWLRETMSKVVTV